MNQISTGHIAANIIKIDKPQPHLFSNLEKKIKHGLSSFLI